MRPFVVISYGNIGVPLDHNVALELADINKGFLPNRLTQAQRDAIVNPPEGLTIFNTDTHVIETYGGGWAIDSHGFLKINNLSEIIDKAAARHNLGLGSAATYDYEDFATPGSVTGLSSDGLNADGGNTSTVYSPSDLYFDGGSTTTVFSRSETGLDGGYYYCNYIASACIEGGSATTN